MVKCDRIGCENPAEFRQEIALDGFAQSRESRHVWCDEHAPSYTPLSPLHTTETAPSGYAGDSRIFRYRKMLASEVRGFDFHYGEHHVLAHNGVIRRARTNGSVKTWKRDTSRVEVPLKYGLYEYFRDVALPDGTMQHLIVLLDESGRPTRNETAAEVQS